MHAYFMVLDVFRVQETMLFFCLYSLKILLCNVCESYFLPVAKFVVGFQA